MASLDQQVPEFLRLVHEFEQRFRILEAEAANGPHEALNLRELRVVEHLGLAGRRIMKDLAAHVALAVNSVTTLVDHLENKGLVARERSTEDRRVIYVGLTAAGRELCESWATERHTAFRWLLAGLTGPERDTFLQLFRKMVRVEAPTPKK